MYNMTEPKISNLTPLPGYLLYPDDTKLAEEYDKLPENVRLNERDGKHWSMYQLMDYFHSGLIPEHSKTNYFEFEIDFTSPHLRISSVDDPNMVQELHSTMTTGLQSLATKIQGLISKLQVEGSTNALKLTQDAMNRPVRGGKGKKIRGGVGEADAAAAAAAAPAPAAPAALPAAAPALPAAPVDTVSQITALLSPSGLEAECLQDLFRVKLNTWDRIFITNAKKNNLPLASVLNLPKESTLVDQVKTAAAAPGPAAAAPVAGGGRRKTRKGRKYGKKSKTHRRRR